MEYDAQNDAYIFEWQLPANIKALIKEVHGETFILVNSNLSDDMKKSAVKHEIRHYQMKHIRSSKPIKQIEKEAIRR